MKIKPIAKSLYSFFGAVFLTVGASVLLLRTGLLPGGLENLVMDVARGDPYVVHLIQELGSLLVFAGLITFWFVQHYEHSKAFHWAMTIFWALFAIVHWIDVRSLESMRGPAINTIPLALFLVVGLLRRKSGRES